MSDVTSTKTIVAVLSAVLCLFVIATSSMTIYVRNTFKKNCSNFNEAENNTEVESSYKAAIALLVISILVFISIIVIMYARNRSKLNASLRGALADRSARAVPGI